jgi:hypothetical protein
LYLVNSQNPGVVILPFENSVVDDGETTYAPGNLFFKSTTIANNSIQSLVQYAEDISRKITNTVDISNDIFDFYNRSYGLLPNNYIQKFLGILKSSLSYINTYQSSGNPSKESLIIPALINYSQTDRTLKYYLFQFVLLLGLCSITNTTDKKLFRNLKTELKTTLKFSNLPFREILLDVNIDQSSDLRGAALAMAREITRYVTQTLIENSSLTLDENASLTPRPRTDGNQNLFLENPEMISRVLIDTVNSSVSNRPNLFKDFVDLASSLDQDASIAGSQDSWLNANLTTSRYSNISISYLLLYLFELICSFTKRYFNVNFDVENGKLFGIVYNKEDCLCALKGVENAIKEIPSSLLSFPTEIRVDLASNASQNSSVSLDTLGLILTYTPEQLRKINEYYDVTKKLANALIDEDTFLKNILGIFGVISTNLSNAKRIGINLYNSLTPAQSDLLRRNANMLKKAQFRIAKTTFDNIKAAKDNNINSLAFNITDDEYYHLLSLSKEMKAEDGERTKLVAVGLPNGFIDSIKGRASKTAAISGAEQIVDLSSTTGIISIAIYRKSLLDEEIIYKPKRFIFDTSLIVNKYQESLTIDPFTSFSEQNGLITLTDLESVKSPKTLTKSSVGNYSKYNTILSNEEKQQMITNHIEDFLFKKYMALYSGIQISEEVFPIAEYQFRNNINDQAQQFMRLVLQTFGISDSRPIKDILADEATPIAVKDSMSLIKNSISFMDMETLDSVIMSEKLFDKILVVKINIDKDFEIDTALTRRQVLQNESIIKRIYKVGEKTFLKDLDGSIMDEFYATIEVLG